MSQNRSEGGKFLVLHMDPLWEKTLGKEIEVKSWMSRAFGRISRMETRNCGGRSMESRSR